MIVDRNVPEMSKANLMEKLLYVSSAVEQIVRYDLSSQE